MERIEKEESPFSTGEKKKKSPTYQRRLDQLAFLLEGRNNCASVTIMDGEFFIATNEFFADTILNRNESLTLNCELMQHFKGLAISTKIINEQSFIQNRDKIMQKMCEYRINNITDGIYKLYNEKFLKTIINTNSLSKDIEKSEFEWGKLKKSEYFHNARGSGLAIFRRISKIENSIIVAINEKNPVKITKEQLNAFKHFNHTDKNNSNIIFSEKARGVHAEMQVMSKIIERIERTNPIMKNTSSELISIYIGISKLCCLNCRVMLESANSVLLSYGFQIEFAGSHDASFDENWKKPFLFGNPRSDEVCEEINYDELAPLQKRDKPIATEEQKTIKVGRPKKVPIVYAKLSKLFEEINNLYEEKIEQIKKELQLKSKQKNKTFNMEKTPSSSDVSLSAEDKVNEYKCKLENQKKVMQELKLYEDAPQKYNMVLLGIDLCQVEIFKYFFEYGDNTEEINLKQTLSSLENKLRTLNHEVNPHILLEFLTNPLFSPDEIVAIFKSFTL